MEEVTNNNNNNNQPFTTFDKCCMYQSGEVIYSANSKSKTAYIVKHGLVKLYSIGAKGNKHIVRMVREGEIIGYYSQFTNQPEVTSCQCMVNTVLCEISDSSLKDAFKTDSSLAFAMLQKACSEMKESYNSIIDMSQNTVRSRVANSLIKQMNLFNVSEGDDFPIRISRTEMAEWIGTSRESVSRSLNDFIREKLIMMDQDTIKIINLDRLMRVIIIS